MSLQKLDVINVRNIQLASLLPSNRINLIFGNNASGKSSLLEAIFFLGRAKSFRTSSVRQLINFNSDNLIVSGKVISNTANVSTIGIKLDGSQIQIRINQESKSSSSALAYTLPVQLIHPKSYKLLDAGPQLRREFMDWGIFNQHKDFLPVWRNFKKALAQRNVMLKNRQTGHINIWDQEILRYGTIVSSYREQYLKQLEPFFIEIINQFLTIDNIQLNLITGWDRSQNLQQVLKKDIDKDLRYGYTTSGPHRGEFQLLINNRSAKHYASRGQLKLLVLSLKLAQVKLMDSGYSNAGCVLIDDLAAELDYSNKNKLLNYLSELHTQVFLTATEINDFGDLKQLREHKVFHVEHGNINQL